MDLEDTMLSETSEKGKYHMLSLTCGIYKQKTQLEGTENRLVDA